MATVKKTARALRESLLSQAEPLIEHKIRGAIGLETNLKMIHVNKEDQKDIWAAIVPMMQSAGDAARVQVESTRDVLGLLGQGVVTFDEALKLIQILERQSNVEDLKAMKETLDQIAATKVK
jgi:hypothetical protein